MTDLLWFEERPSEMAGRPLFMEFPSPIRIEPVGHPARWAVVSATRGLLWVMPKVIIRAAPCSYIEGIDRMLVDAIASKPEFKGANKFPLTPQGMRDAFHYIYSRSVGGADILHGEGFENPCPPTSFRYERQVQVPWLKPHEAVVVPKDRGQLGYLIRYPFGDFVVVHNPLKYVSLVGFDDVVEPTPTC